MQSADLSVFTHKYQRQKQQQKKTSNFWSWRTKIEQCKISRRKCQRRFDLTVVDWAALFSTTQVWETQHHHSGESLLLSEHRSEDAAMFHRLFEGFEGETVPGVGMQCQSNGDCTGFNLTTKMKKKKGKKRQDLPQFLKCKREKKATWVAWFVFFTRLVLRSMFFLFSTHEGLMSSFLKCSYD